MITIVSALLFVFSVDGLSPHKSKKVLSLTRTPELNRRSLLGGTGAWLCTTKVAKADRPDFVTTQPGFEKLSSGLQIKNGNPGKGDKVIEPGDRVVYKWEGYTIGYFGRPFEAQSGVKGGDFATEQDFERFVVGKGTVVPALEQGVLGMREGAVRQIVFGTDLGYPFIGDPNRGVLADPDHSKVGPTPHSFSGMRALNFVLENKGDRIDKTMLLTVKVVRIDKLGFSDKK
uniref:peptidylprolyl isomerase n=1 Tax=Octactis speculum TaxID=3111310 RepID=A0A7S2H1E9_9STRA